MTWLLKGGHVLDPVRGVDEVLDVTLADGVITAIGRDLPSAAHVLDCRGRYVVPGLIDIGARVGEPGFEHRETVASATRAAAAGGFSALCALPDADPVPDVPAAVRFILEQAKQDGVVRIHPLATITKGGLGAELAEMGALQAAGAVALADLHGVANAALLRRALQYARMFALLLVVRSRDAALADDGVMHEGLAATIRGLKGIPAAAEEVAIVRDIIIAELTGADLHIMAVSSGGAVEQIRAAKARGVPVTASVSAHQLIFTDENVQADDTRWKVDPPLRGAEDVEALRKGVQDGTIDCIFSDHTPIAREEKDVEFAYAPCGMTGLETALPLVLGELVTTGELTLDRAVQCMSVNPARIFGVPGGTLAVGCPADITVIDLEAERVFDVTRSHSQSRNTPVDGRPLTGLPVATFVGGKLIMRDGRIVV